MKAKVPHGKYWFISLMTEIGYPILYHFNLILGVSSYLALDVIHKSLETSEILLKIHSCTTVSRNKDAVN